MSDEIGVRVWPSKSSQNVRQNSHLIHYNPKEAPIYGGGEAEPIIDYNHIRNERTKTFNSVDLPTPARSSTPKTGFRHSDHPHFASANTSADTSSGSPRQHERSADSTSGHNQMSRTASVAYREEADHAIAQLDHVIADDERRGSPSGSHHPSNQSSISHHHNDQHAIIDHHSNQSSVAERSASHHSSVVEHHHDNQSSVDEQNASHHSSIVEQHHGNQGSEASPPSRPHYEPISLDDIFPIPQGQQQHGNSVMVSGDHEKTEEYSSQHHGHHEHHDQQGAHHHEHHDHKEGDHHEHHEHKEGDHHEHHEHKEGDHHEHQEAHGHEHHDHHEDHHHEHHNEHHDTHDAHHHEHHDHHDAHNLENPDQHDAHHQEHHDHHDAHHHEHHDHPIIHSHEHDDKAHHHEHHETLHKVEHERQPHHADHQHTEYIGERHSNHPQAVAAHHHYSGQTGPRPEPLAVEDIRAKLEKMNIAYKPYATDPTSHEPPVDYEPLRGQRNRSDTEERRRHEQYMHAEKSDDYTSNVSAPVLHEDVIQDLRKMTDGIGSLAAIKAERREQALAREQEARDEIARVQAMYTPQYFLSQTPATFSGTDAPVPEWKRMMIAKKLAAAAFKEEEQRIWHEFEEWKKQFEPNWKKSTEQRSSITNTLSP